MIRFATIAVVLALSGTASAQQPCVNGQCPIPSRTTYVRPHAPGQYPTMANSGVVCSNGQCVSVVSAAAAKPGFYGNSTAGKPIYAWTDGTFREVPQAK